MKSIDIYLSKVYHARDYNCAHFLCEVWKDLTGYSIDHILEGALSNRARRVGSKIHMNLLQRVPNLVDPCIVLVYYKRAAPHVGMYTRRRILDLSPEGARFRDPEIVFLGTLAKRFYVCR